MGRASQSQLTISKSISVRRAALHQRQGLNELYRRAGKDRSVRLPDFPDGFSVAIKNRHRTTMNAFHQSSAKNLCQYRICHVCRLLPGQSNSEIESRSDLFSELRKPLAALARFASVMNPL
jgi:hypothetical protein